MFFPYTLGCLPLTVYDESLNAFIPSTSSPQTQHSSDHPPSDMKGSFDDTRLVAFRPGCPPFLNVPRIVGGDDILASIGMIHL